MKRVLHSLVHLGVVNKDKPIYFKSDALTWLDIFSDNPCGLKATRYSSLDVFKGKI